MSDQPASKEEEVLPVATLISGDDAKAIATESFSFGCFEASKDMRQKVLEEEAISRLKELVAPKVKQETEQLKKEAFEDAQKQGYEAGYQEGFAEGEKQGLQTAQLAAEEQLNPLVANIESLLQTMRSPYQSLENDVYQSLVSLSIGIAEKIIEHEVTMDSDRVLSVLQQAISTLPDETVKLAIEINPRDAETLENYRQEFSKNWDVQLSNSVEPGDCRVRHENSVVESVWRQQLTKVAEEVFDQAHIYPPNEEVEESPLVQTSETEEVLAGNERNG